jgi:hypothetical protein
MRPSIIISAIFAALILGGCSDQKKISTTDLASALNIQIFIIEIPKNLPDSDLLVLELVGENGVVDYSTITSLENNLSSRHLKVFLNNADPTNPDFSFVTKSIATTSHSLKLGKAEVKGWNTQKTYKIGECFAFCSEDGTTRFSQQPKGDDFGIRINIKSR